MLLLFINVMLKYYMINIKIKIVIKIEFKINKISKI